jgi:hypothetical protein
MGVVGMTKKSGKKACHSDDRSNPCMNRKEFLELMGAGLGLAAEEVYSRPERKKQF